MINKTNTINSKVQDIKIKKHVWMAQNIMVLPGVEIQSNCVVGACSVVTKSFEPNCIIAGNPANVVRKNIDWNYKYGLSYEDYIEQTKW